LSGKLQNTLVMSLTSHIHQSRREVTVLFTDIEDSTRYWGNRGDVEGRLMVDRHNRILLPLVRQFHGKVLKTIGDSIMAMFNSPDAAMNAAIAMQQALQRVREEERDFRIRVRIGLHIGEGIVESDDVFGDVVNIAARIKSEADANEILISGRLARRLDKQQFKRGKKGSFTPKGKNRPMAVYRVDWQQHQNLLLGLKRKPLVPLGRRQSLEMLGYAMLLLTSLYFVYASYLRYLLSDNETLALLFLNPTSMLQRYWYIGLGAGTVIFSSLWWAMGINAIPSRILRMVKSTAAGGILFVLLSGLSSVLPAGLIPGFELPIYHSRHLFVEVLADSASIRERPDDAAQSIMQQSAGSLLLLTDVTTNGDTTWNKVLVGEERFGWIKRVQPPRIGIAEERVTLAQPFRLRYGDIYLLLLSLPGFVWGYRSFRIRPL